MRTRRTVSATLLAVLLLLGGALRSASLELRGSGGPGTWGVGATADGDIGRGWAASISDDFIAVTGTSAPSQTDMASLDFTKVRSESWQLKAGFDYCNDAVNQILYVGPDLGATYYRLSSSPKDSSAQEDEDGDDQGTLFTLTFDAPVHAYVVGLGANSEAGVTKKTKTTNGVPYVITDDAADLDVTQFGPELTLSLPLGAGAWTPSLSYAHDFYDKNPGELAELITRRFQTGSGSFRMNTLTGELFSDTVGGALRLKRGAWTLSGGFSASELLSPVVWMTTGEASLEWAIGAKVRFKAGWDDSCVEGESTPGYNGALTVTF
jgi:hypothetical protein